MVEKEMKSLFFLLLNWCCNQTIVSLFHDCDNLFDRVLLVVPYPKLEQTVKKIYKEYFRDTEFEVDIRVIQAEEIKHMPWDEAYDLVIGRGHSAAILKQKDYQVPVLEIPITGYDILRALLKAKEQYHATRIAVIVSSAQTHDETILSSILGAQVSVKTCQDFERVSEIIEDVKQNNYDAVVGGYSVTSQALRKHMNAITVETGEEAMIQILHEAARMMGTIYQEHERRKIYETITQTSKEGIIYVNGKKEIALVNKKMLQMIYTDKGLIRGKQLHEVYPFFEEKCAEAIQTKQPVYNAVQNVDNTTFTIDYVPVIVGDKAAGVVITCQTVKKIQQIESQIRKKLSEKGLVAAYTFSDMIRKSDLMESTVTIARKFAAVSSNVLIVGETGTGKELMAQSIHNASERSNGPFVAVNCAALPENLLESELFGYADGAFTGSRRGGKMGFFEQAHRGTLFLDEISEIPINFQGKLLRALQERQIRRIGDDKVVDVDTRIIAATNRNLRQMVIDHEFRQDLLYRLDVLKVYIPPLRERTADILPLFSYFLNKYNNKFGKDIAGLTPEAQKMLRNYHFEGNIRELRNIAERVSVMCEHDTIDKHLMETALYPEDVFSSSERKRTDNDSVLHEENTISPNVSIEEEQIREALRKTGGKKTRAAELLGMDRSTLWRKMKSYHIE